MDDPVAQIARATADHLTTDYGSNLTTDVEAALHTRDSTTADRYSDPIAIAGLIVAIATLAWTIYADLRKAAPSPPPEIISRNIRIQLQQTHSVDTDISKIIDVAVNETINHASR